jgi:hypothetical protein
MIASNATKRMLKSDINIPLRDTVETSLLGIIHETKENE